MQVLPFWTGRTRVPRRDGEQWLGEGLYPCVQQSHPAALGYMLLDFCVREIKCLWKLETVVIDSVCVCDLSPLTTLGLQGHYLF